MIGGIVHQQQLRFDCLPKWRMQKKRPSFLLLEQSVLYSISFYIIASYKKHIDYVYTFQVLSRTQMLRVNVQKLYCFAGNHGANHPDLCRCRESPMFKSFTASGFDGPHERFFFGKKTTADIRRQGTSQKQTTYFIHS